MQAIIKKINFKFIGWESWTYNAIAIVLILVWFGLLFSGFIPSNRTSGSYASASSQKAKTYTVTFTQNEWVYYQNGIGYIVKELRESDMPSKKTNLMVDSVLAPLFNKIARADTLKSK